jgi:hypothetical protein
MMRFRPINLLVGIPLVFVGVRCFQDPEWFMRSAKAGQETSEASAPKLPKPNFWDNSWHPRKAGLVFMLSGLFVIAQAFFGHD